MIHYPSAATRRIYHNLLLASKSYILPGLWREMRTHVGVRTPPANPKAWLRRMNKVFTAAQLVRAGVARPGLAECLEPVPALCGARPLIGLVSDDPEPHFFGVIGADGDLHARQPLPVLAAMADEAVQGTLREWDNHLLVAATIEDMAVLRSLGFPAALATGLAGLHKHQLKSLMNSLKWNFSRPRNPGPQSSQDCLVSFDGGDDGASDVDADIDIDADEDYDARTQDPSPSGSAQGPSASPTAGAGPPSPGASMASPPAAASRAADSPRRSACRYAPFFRTPPHLVIVDWSPAQLLLEQPAAAAASMAHLRHLQNSIDIKNMSIGRWTPSPAYVEKLQAQLAFDAGCFCRTEFFQNLEDYLFDALADSPNPADKTDGLQSALKEFRDALGDEGSGLSPLERRHQATARYHEVLERDLLGPLFRPAASPRQRNFQIVAQQLLRLLHTALPVADEAVRRAIRADRLRCGELLPPKQLAEVEKLLRLVLSVTKRIYT